MGGAQYGDQRPEDERHQGRERRPQPDAVHQRAAGILLVVGAEGLGDERVHAEQHACAADGDGEKDHAAQAAGADGGRSQRACHQGVDDAHEHPPKLGDG